MFALAALVGLLALAAPVTRGAVHNVTVGGIGILKYDPASVVSTPALRHYDDETHGLFRTRIPAI